MTVLVAWLQWSEAFLGLALPFPMASSPARLLGCLLFAFGLDGEWFVLAVLAALLWVFSCQTVRTKETRPSMCQALVDECRASRPVRDGPREKEWLRQEELRRYRMIVRNRRWQRARAGLVHTYFARGTKHQGSETYD